jgi:hypothetical protein
MPFPRSSDASTPVHLLNGAKPEGDLLATLRVPANSLEYLIFTVTFAVTLQ